jgi:hypothetical protein
MTYRRVLTSPGVALRIVTDDRAIAGKLEERLGAHLSDGAADAELRLDAARIEGAQWDPDLLGRLDGSLLHVEQSGGRGAFDLSARSGRIAIAADIEWFHLYIENALRMILVELAERAGMRICHTAAVSEPDLSGAWLFHGPSGSGKTTSTEMALAQGWRPINDDLVFIGLDGGGVIAQGCAFHGRTRIRDFAHGRFPVKGLFRLVQAGRHRATRLALPDAVRELSRALVSWRPRTRAEQESLLDFAIGVCRRVPAFRLEFTKDPSFLEAARNGLR